MKKTLPYLIVVALAFLFVARANAQVPRTISYQGALMNGSTPASGPHTLLLKLYTAASGGSTVYTESQGVTVTNGIFNVLIGSVTPIPNSLTFDQQYYLGVSVDGGPEMTPRSALSASPYAMHAAVADQLAGGSSSGISTITNSDGTMLVTNPNGPTTTIGINDASITSSKLAPNVLPTSLPPIGSAGGDLGGVYPNPIVARLNNVPLGPGAPAAGQSLIFNGSTWSPATIHDITLFDSGTLNPTRVFVKHSPAYPTWGIQYNDTLDEIGFVAGGLKNASVSLATGDISSIHNVSAANVVVSKKLQRGTDTSNMMAIAWGSFTPTGTFLTGSSNVSLVSHTTGVYIIAISGETFHFSTHMAIATIGDSPGMIYATSSGGNVYISTTNTTGTPTDHYFQFAVYKK